MASLLEPLNTKNCLVIGGAGNLGSHIVGLLLDRKATVSSFDRVPCRHEANGAKSIVGDICDFESLKAALGGVDIVFHAASVIDIRPVPSPSLQRINVEGTKNVVAACKAVGIKTLIYTSSMEAVSGYVGSSKSLPDFLDADESTPIPDRHCLPYARTKAAAEAMVLEACSESLKTVSLRPGYIVGAGCIGLKIEMDKAIDRSNYYMTAQLPTRMNCVNVKNCAMAHILAAERSRMPNVAGEKFFISDFQANIIDMAVDSLRDTGVKPVLLPLWFAYGMGYVLDRAYRFVHFLWSLFGKELDIPQTIVDIHAVNLAWRNLCFSTKRAREILGYGTPASDFFTKEETLKQQHEWAKDYYGELLARSGKGLKNA
eukprot:CAMPEP_0206458964 /NCGR_PEP_ID=MMETSP0324_2-20121206/23891_1 /ASSEMBLY_ACC=CAM_ASM_000836 /TAXON_ID=2866 /ORGANISM="Crypthecodinium cohnii, Strain Seligo" /LENGTH=371 /DNA_ID=CAMNT_0053930419 /DNA_START=24 /DNA_END=1139 /DNA_ORIENTATION=+